MVEFLLVSIIATAFIAYAVLGGADFGAGIWEFNTGLRSSEEDKKLIYRAIGPVWEANHVWLIFGMTGLWCVYPRAFAEICSFLAIPLSLALAGIVFRGAAYAFRSTFLSHSSRVMHKKIWETLFAIASTWTPFFFGFAVGMLSGEPTHPGFDPDPAQSDVESERLRYWFFEPLFFGFFAVGICAYVSSVFLVREASVLENRALEERWRTRALRMGYLVGTFSIAGLFLTAFRLKALWNAMASAFLPTWPAAGLAIVAGVATLFALHGRRYRLAAMLSVLTVTSVLVGWVLAMHFWPQSADSDLFYGQRQGNVDWLLLSCMIGGMLLITPPMIWLFYIFKAETRLDSVDGQSEDQPVDD